MNDVQIREWMATLPTPAKDTIDDLMLHANEDEMSGEDRSTCLRAIELLKQDEWAYGSGLGTLSGYDDL